MSLGQFLTAQPKSVVKRCRRDCECGEECRAQLTAGRQVTAVRAHSCQSTQLLQLPLLCHSDTRGSCTCALLSIAAVAGRLFQSCCCFWTRDSSATFKAADVGTRSKSEQIFWQMFKLTADPHLHLSTSGPSVRLTPPFYLLQKNIYY